MLLSEEYFTSENKQFYVDTERVSEARVNINVFDSHNKLILQIKDLGVRSMKSNSDDLRINTIEDQKEEETTEKLHEHITYKPEWKCADLEPAPSLTNYYIIAYLKGSEDWAKLCHLYLPNSQLICLDGERSLQDLEQSINSKNTEIWIIDANIDNTFDSNLMYLKGTTFLNLLKKLNPTYVLSLKLITKNGITLDEYDPQIQPVNSMLLGLAQTASKEYTNWTICPISTDEINDAHLNLIRREDNQDNPNNEPVIFKNGHRYTRQLVHHTIEPTNISRGFRHNGTYVIIGGLGGLGYVLAQHLAKKYQANLILLGRSQPDNVKLEHLAALGGKVTYLQVDILDEENLRKAINKYESINGIFHSALVLKDKTIQFMDTKTLFDVLDPKVKGVINLAKILEEKNYCLDFILFFSSIQSFIANPGQANYTAACVFKDAMAHMLRNFYMYNTKIIHWGYWGNVGIVSSNNYKKRMEKLGIGSIEDYEGLKIIEDLLASDLSQISVIKATKTALSRLNIHYKEDHKIMDTSTLPQKDILEKIVPLYDRNDPSIKINEQAQEALEHYSRYAIKEVILPSDYKPEYAKLVAAIENIPPTPYVDKEQILSKHPELYAHIKLLDRCIEYYPKVLTGQLDHMSVLFPDGKFDLVEPIYRDNPTSDYFNKTVAEVVRNYHNYFQKKDLKIIEIGAGTGSTTKFVLPAIREFNSEYYYTDLSFAFLKKAQEEFKIYKNINYQICNIEQTPSEKLQGKFDIVLATNVLHATKDIQNTLKNVRALLKEGGIAVLNEVTSKQDYATLTFGLTTGWWLFQDHRIPDSPLLSSQTWKELLEKSGFGSLASHGSEAQQVIVALAGNGLSLSENTSFSTQLPIESSGVSPILSQDVKENHNNTSLSLNDEVEEFIAEAMARVMKLEKEDISNKTPFSHYGIDSLIVLELLKPFKEKFGYIPTTVFFEHPTISDLAQYFINEHPDICKRLNPRSNISPNLETSNLKPKLNSFLKEKIAHVMRMTSTDIQDETVFKTYGIDSLITLEIMKPLNEIFGYLPGTLLFEYPTINDLCNYFIKDHLEKITSLFDTNEVKTLSQEEENLTQKGILKFNTGFQEDDVAIIGIAGQFPEAENCQELWDNLLQEKNCIRVIPSERWDIEHYYDPKEEKTADSMYTRYGGFLKNIEFFDHKFFEITPYDAEKIDPQERLFLQETYHALEDAGYAAAHLKGKEVGVFVGVMNGGYGWLGVDAISPNDADSLYWSIANRTSYTFDWHGPSMAIDTACSSSLTALHLACQALKNGDCSLAIVGGVNLIVHPRQYTKLCKMHMLSKGDQCKSFGGGADGFIDGEGIVSFVLKPCNQALADKDRIYGIIKGTAINAGGKSNGYTAPNPNAQAQLIKKTLERARIDPLTLSYVEAHGTGTELGDPVEIRGLTKAFQTEKNQFCALGSVKSNIGHLESAAGLAGLTKVLLQMMHKKLVPSLNSTIESLHINFKDSPFYIQKNLSPWTVPANQPRRAIVSSFGAGGANANVVIEEAPQISYSINHPPYIIPLSAKTTSSLTKQIDKLREWINKNPELNLSSLAYTLACGRDHFTRRACFVVDSIGEFKTKLEEFVLGSELPLESYSTLSLEALAETYLQSSGEEREKLARSIQSRYLQGQIIPWEKIYPNKSIVSIPTYCFDPFMHWIEEAKFGLTRMDRYIQHHKIYGKCLLPAAYPLAQALKNLETTYKLEDFYWIKAIDSIKKLSNSLNNGEFSVQDEVGDICVKGSIKRVDHEIEQPVKINDLLTFTELPKLLSQEELYNYFTALGYEYGSSYRKVSSIRIGNASAFATIDTNVLSDFSLDPTIIDAVFQVAITPDVLKGLCSTDEIFVPYHLKKLHCWHLIKDGVAYCFANIKASSPKEVTGDIYLFNEKMELAYKFENITSKAVSKATLFSKNDNIQDVGQIQQAEGFKLYKFN